jgi:glycosyltransferase involved in cell wall biosynthesis
VNDYEVEPEKITVAACGANLDRIPDRSSLHFNTTDQLRLLFLGVEWDRKGGDIVIEAYRELKRQGLRVTLHIIGCTPPFDVTDEDGITVIPFLDKNKPGDFDRLDRIFRETDLLFLPTRAECAGVVFSESSAYGIPSLTTDTGGVSTYVKNNVNGFALSWAAGAEEYAEKVIELNKDKSAMLELKRNSRRFYEEKLSWDLWGDHFKKIVQRLQ